MSDVQAVGAKPARAARIGVAELAPIWPRLGELPPTIAAQLEIDAKYDVYLARQTADIAAFLDFAKDAAVSLFV